MENSSEEEDARQSKSHRDLFQKKNAGMFGYDSYDSESDGESSQDDYGDQMETNLMNNQNAFAFNNNQSLFGNFASSVGTRKAVKKRAVARPF